MELDYFNFMNRADISGYNFFIISGDEPLQKHNVIEKITSKFKLKGFDIIRHDLTEQNHSSLYDEADSLSLFSTEKFIQFSMDKPPQKNLQNALIETLCKPSDNIYLVIFSQLKKPTMTAKWFQTLSQNAVHIKIYNPNTTNAIQIVKAEISKEDGLQLNEDAIQILVQKTEGNLIATKQILKLLGRQKEKAFDIKNIRPFLHEHSSHDIFDLSDALLCKNRKKSLMILNHLLQESDKPPLILWAIKKELRIIQQLKDADTNSHSKIFKENNIWLSKQKYYSSAANKISKETIILNLKKCLEIDLCIKGAHKGNIKLMLNEIIFNITQ